MKKIITILVSLIVTVVLYGISENANSKLLDEKKESQEVILDMGQLLEEQKTETEQKEETEKEETENEEETWEFYEDGKASFYGGRFHGRKTASGEKFNKNEMTAAHKTLPFGTKVKVTNLGNGKSVVVRINDRGPFIKGRVIDLSKSAFAAIERLNKGVTKVKLEILK